MIAPYSAELELGPWVPESADPPEPLLSDTLIKEQRKQARYRLETVS